VAREWCQRACLTINFFRKTPLAVPGLISLASVACTPLQEERIIPTANTQGRPRLAASSYLNTAPLIWSFQQGTRRELVRLVTDAAPARCADLLARTRVEAALVPIIEYQRIPEIRVVPNVCVGSHSAVRSVVLISKHDDLKHVRSVALDDSSRTSQALIKIIFREFLGFEPEWESRAPNPQLMMERSDAALLIGDPAMKISQEDFHVFDLASLWRRFTGTGFVFAMWMVGAAAVEAIGELDFAGARDEGLAQIERIIAQYENDLPLPRDEIRKYLTDNITFHVDESLETGMRLYFELAQKHGLIEDNKPLQFIAS
jgi:chorismate dehydratase